MRKEDISKQTRAQLADALVQLLKKKPIDKISIREITDACDFPRSTFYYHYEDIYDLAAWIMSDGTIRAMRIGGKPATLWDESVMGLFESFQRNMDIIRNLLTSKEFLRMADLFCARTVDAILPDIIALDGERHTDPDFLYFLVMFYGHSMIDVCSKWLRGGMMTPAEDMVKVLNLIIRESFLLTLERVQDVQVFLKEGYLPYNKETES